jgi:hypothetical protein
MSGMEQIGQFPGFGIRICGCIEQVQISAAGVAATEGLAAAGGDCAPASGTKISRPAVKTAQATVFRKSRSKVIIEPRAWTWLETFAGPDRFANRVAFASPKNAGRESDAEHALEFGLVIWMPS